jgi:hypothetical protein
LSSKIGAFTKMIKPSSAVSCELSKYSDDGERIKLLEKRGFRNVFCDLCEGAYSNED